jgi:hypothetical protein
MNTDKQNIPILHIVHCIDTEGPLYEDIQATFERLDSIFGIKMEASPENLRKLQKKKIYLEGLEDAVAKCFAPELLKYNTNWAEISDMLDEALSSDFRSRMLDDFGNGWVYSWHCMDHIGYNENPRHKDAGYGNVFRYYKSKLALTESSADEINWHFHPLSLARKPTQAATSYLNSYDVLLPIICRRILDDQWFPVVNRPGFHAERPDSHAFMEQWLPFDYANQFVEEKEDQPDVSDGRFGDWRRAPKTWRGYHPSHDDYQVEGNCRRIIFRCLNLGTRLRSLTTEHFHEAFKEAKENGSAVLAFADHDYRDIRTDVATFRAMLLKVKNQYPEVKIKFSGAEAAALAISGNYFQPKLVLTTELIGNKFFVKLQEGELFGPQPFLAIKLKSGQYFHDNMDMIEPGKVWAYVLDEQTFKVEALEKIGVGSAGRFGGYNVSVIETM